MLGHATSECEAFGVLSRHGWSITIEAGDDGVLVTARRGDTQIRERGKAVVDVALFVVLAALEREHRGHLCPSHS